MLALKVPESTKKTLGSVEAGRPCDSYTRPSSEGRFGSCCSRQSLLRRPMKGRSRACAKMGAHSLARACDGARRRQLQESFSELKNTRRRRRPPPAARMPRRRILGAKFNGRFFFPPTTSHITGNCNTLKDNLILSLIRYVVAIKL